MKLHSETHLEEIDFVIDPHTRKIAVTDFEWKAHIPFSEKDSRAIAGAETLEIPKCESRQEFIAKLNQSEFVHVSVHDDFFTIQDCSAVFAEQPAGLYKSNTINKRVSLYKESNGEYSLRQYVDTKNFTGTARNMYLRGGMQNVENSFVSFSGTTSHAKLLEANALLLGSDLVSDNNKVPLEVSKTSGLKLFRAEEKEQVVELQKNGRVVLPALLQEDSVVLSLIGQNNGLFMKSPVISWVNDHNQGLNQDALEVSECGFVLRAGTVYREKHITVVAPFPSNTKALLIKRVAANIWEVSAIKKDESLVVCLRTVAIGANARLCFSDYEQTVKQFLLPTIRKCTENASRDGFLAASFRSPASNAYTVLSSPKFDLSVANSVLVVNGVTTSLAVAQGINYLLVLEKDSDLDISLLNLDASTTQTFTDAAPSYTHGTAMAGLITWASGLVLGPYCMGDVLSNTDMAVQIVRAEVQGKPTSVNLGAFSAAAKTFANYSASYAESVGNGPQVLTVSGLTYTRQKLEFSPQVANILRTGREFVGTYSSPIKSYKKRIRKAHIYCDGLDVAGFNNSNLIALVDIKKGIKNPVFHECRGKLARMHYVLIDSQTERERHFVKPPQAFWSLSVETL